MAGRPGVRGPGRGPLGAAPGLCCQGLPCPPLGPPGPPPCRGVKGRLPWPDCGRIGCPGRGPLGRSLPGTVPGTGPRLPPVGIGGRGGTVGRDAGVVAPAAGRALAGCAPGWDGRALGGTLCGVRAPIGCPGIGAAGRGALAGVGRGVAGAVEEGAAGAAGLAATGAVGATGDGAAGFATGAVGADGAIGAAGFAGAGACAAGACAAGACGATGACGGAGAAGLAANGACGAAAGASGFAAGSAGSFAAGASTASSASAEPCNCRRTFSATSTGIELECVFFSVTPKPGRRSIIAFALTSSSRANSLIRTWDESLMLR